MTPLAIGALLAVAAMVWVIAPIFSETPEEPARGGVPSPAADDAAEAAIRRWREPKA
jgi:hypothetical protein